MAGLLIRGGEVVSATGRVVADVLCEGGVVRAVGPALVAPGAQVLDARGLLVLPGGVDVHTHMELPLGGDLESSDDFFTGTAAALAGGTTTIVDFAVPERGESLLSARDRWLAKGEKACADWALHMSVTSWSEQVRRELRALFADGITSFKTYLAYVDTIGIDDATLMHVLEGVGELGGLVTVHAEHGLVVKDRQRRLLAAGQRAPRFHPVSRPPFVEAEAVGRAIALARSAEQPLYVVHVSCAESLEVLEHARRDGLSVFAETCPHYLLLDESVYDRPDEQAMAYVLSPPLRPKPSPEALWRGLGAGILETVATDHCPFTAADKRRGLDDFTRIPNGAGGVEHRLELLWTHGVKRGRLTAEQFVNVCSTRPAQLFGLWPRKGELRPGSDADVVLFDPARTGRISAATHRQRTDLEIFEGFALEGRVHTTVARGNVVYRDGTLDVHRGAGRFLARTASGSPPV